MEKDYNIDDILNEVKNRQSADEKESPAPEIKEVEEIIEKAEESVELAEEEPVVDEQPEEEAPVFTEIREEPIEKVAEEASEPEEAEGFVDLNEMSEQAEEPAEDTEAAAVAEDAPKKKKHFTKKGVAILLAIVIAMSALTYIAADHMINQKLQGIVQEDPDAVEWAGMDALIEDFSPIEETDASELASFKDDVKTWYKNGTPCSSSHVLNILLIGEDTRGKEIMDDGTRADSAIICSINKDTQTITLTSILRDTYAYWEDTFGDESTGQFNKINAAMSLGNVKTYCKTVEQLYKVKIDNYVIVNFTSFEKIIDTLGGVTLKLTTREINEINRHPKRYGNVVIEQEFEGTEGKQKLNGKQALAYCRIRKLDSDNKRADRQKTCLTKVYKEFKKTSLSNVIKVAEDLLPYVKTNMPVKSIKAIAKYALSNNWQDYDVVNTTVPEARINEKGSGGTHWGTWCWKTDFAQDAYNLQMKIYGKSSITLARTRIDVLNCAEEGYFSEGAPATTAVIYNANYGEVTTLPAPEKEEDEETTKA